ncbi:putative maleylacetoacetate isomerase [Scytonema sp. HK-05]|uniref:maleylacetoacetate isomerase n=1 Tax=Scytonema sp. HK-05 TaxID=1137095 RepID=UPI000935FA3E|nr:maleylacetoacetate isomerase [Scytonema sp. HK-05]OKH52763.1 maleylacetoacetate isomerase [Scytonema sp. HK-05]BAY43568.1 putative maleylacetoacetate isomerase [Scytonema sp. HK-05]
MLELYSYYRSTASYRVRIALELKKITYLYKSVSNLRKGELQFTDEYYKINPQKMVPTLIDGEAVISQSLAIIEYLEERYPQPALLPKHSFARAYSRQIALLVACDIHPLNIKRVRQYLTSPMGHNHSEKMDWYRHWVDEGLTAIEYLLTNSKFRGSFCYGNEPTIADLFLVPQVYNAERFGCPLQPYPTIYKIYEVCMNHPAFIAAQPHLQPDVSEYSPDDEY